MGRKIRTTLPTLKKNLQPKWPNRLQVRETNASAKTQQAFYFNHGVRELPELKLGDEVLMKLDSEKLWKDTVRSNQKRSLLVLSWYKLRMGRERRGGTADTYSLCQQNILMLK